MAQFLDVRAAAFFAVLQHEDEGNFAPLRLDALDGLDGGTTGGDHVIHHDHAVTWLEIAFHEFLAAVFLGFLAHAEGVDGMGRIGVFGTAGSRTPPDFGASFAAGDAAGFGTVGEAWAGGKALLEASAW